MLTGATVHCPGGFLCHVCIFMYDVWAHYLWDSGCLKQQVRLFSYRIQFYYFSLHMQICNSLVFATVPGIFTGSWISMWYCSCSSLWCLSTLVTLLSATYAFVSMTNSLKIKPCNYKLVMPSHRCYLIQHFTESCFVSSCSASTETSVCLYGVVYLHVFLLEAGRPISHPESKTW